MVSSAYSLIYLPLRRVKMETTQPKTLKDETLQLSDAEKDIIEHFLIKWGLFYYKLNTAPKWETVIKEVLGYDEKTFEEKVKDYEGTLNVLGYLKNLKRYGKRPVTQQEIINALNGSIASRNVYVQIKQLIKWGEIKEHVLTLPGKHKITLYSAV